LEDDGSYPEEPESFILREDGFISEIPYKTFVPAESTSPIFTDDLPISGPSCF